MRVVAITGAASGIGRATAERFRRGGDRVIGIDLHEAEVTADLGTAVGRAAMLREVAALAPDGLDTIIAAAGISGLAQGPELVMAVNYFGAVATLEGLRPLLAKSACPCAVVVLSTAALPELAPVDLPLVETCLSGDEDAARKDAARKGLTLAYPASKHALSHWLRRAAVRPEWAGMGVLLNGVAPGTVLTPMTLPILATEEGRAMLAKATPIAVKDYARPEALAEAVHFLGSLEGRYTVGQILYVDGGSEALARPALV